MNKKKIASLGLLITLLSGLANEVRTQVTLNTNKIIEHETYLKTMHEDIKIIKQHILKVK